MLTPIIALPSDFSTNITGNASQIFIDLAPYTTLIIGVFLGVMVVGIIIHYIKK